MFNQTTVKQIEVDDIPKNQLFEWFGGKKWLKKELYNQTTVKQIEVDYYLEPFVGGLGSFFSLATYIKYKHIILNDINDNIINVYNSVKNNPQKVIKFYQILSDEFYKTIPKERYELHKTKDKIELKILLEERKNYYQLKRTEFNELRKTQKNKEKISSLFLFLLEHSFNSLYRENKSGGFNAPFNWDNKILKSSRKINIINEYHIFFNKYNIHFENIDVFEFLKKYKNNNSFLYLDPPYLNDKKHENKYNKDLFLEDKQIKLLNLIKDKTFIYSNHYMNLFSNFFNKNNIKYIIIERKNFMSSKKETRKELRKEILATNI